VTQTGLTLSWTASTDNVGVTGYDVYRAGTKIGTTSGATTYGVTGLACNTTSTFAVAAFDAAGNRSTQSQFSAATSPCTSSPAGPVVSVATTGNDATCVRGDATKACASLDKAYAVAQCGDTVEVAGGTYASQSVTEQADMANCTTDVTFQPKAGASVTIPRLLVGACCGLSGSATNAPDHVTFRGFAMPDGFAVDGDANYVTFDRIDGGSFYIGGGNQIKISNSDFGPCYSSGEPSCDSFFRQIVIANAGTSQNITLEGNTIHDFRLTGAGDHFECIRMDGVTNLTFRGNRFFNCELYGTTSTGMSGTTLSRTTGSNRPATRT